MTKGRAKLTQAAHWAGMARGSLFKQRTARNVARKLAQAARWLEWRADDRTNRTLSEKEAVRALFGVESAFFRDRIYHDWLPLPMYFSSADTF